MQFYRSRHRVTHVISLLLGLLLAGGVGGRPRGVPDLTAELATCPIAPVRDSVRIDCCGVLGYSSASPSELMDAFPATWGGRPITGIGLGVRPPGLAFRFDHAVRLYLAWNSGGIYSFEPPEIGHSIVAVDSVFVSWHPLAPHESSGSTYFGYSDFHLEMLDSALVVITATVNLTAIYAIPGDTLEVWGAEIGMPDIELRGDGLATPTAVIPTTWGQLKHRATKSFGR